MTKKDYELIARSIYASIEDLKDFELEVSRDEFDEITNHIIENLASALAATNPRFHRNKFVEACGL